jgi:polyisoprenoid-binding protein YceI
MRSKPLFLGASVCGRREFATILWFMASLGIPGCRNQPNGAFTRSDPTARATQRLERYVVIGPAPGEAAPIRFEFPPPEDAYRGEVRRVRGELLLGTFRNERGSHGWFEVDITDVTMGDADLDENVRFNIEFLEGRRFPLARFDVDKVTESPSREGSEQVRHVALFGRFTLKGRTVPLHVKGRIRPVGDENGPGELVLETSWTLDQLSERFNIIGPGSPVVDEDELAAEESNSQGFAADSSPPRGRPGDRLNFQLHVLLQRVAE